MQGDDRGVKVLAEISSGHSCRRRMVNVSTLKRCLGCLGTCSRERVYIQQILRLRAAWCCRSPAKCTSITVAGEF